MIAACVCLHNFCLHDPLPNDADNRVDDDNDDDDDENELFNGYESENARNRRDAISLTFA